MVFGRKKVVENRYIIAVKNYEDTVQKIKEGKISLPYDASIYLKLFESQSGKLDNLKDMRKFAKASRKSLKEVRYYWEGLILDGYALLNVEYTEKIPAIDHVCNTAVTKFVCSV